MAAPCVLLSVLLLLPAANAFADHVTLKNGDGVTGRITSTLPTQPDRIGMFGAHLSSSVGSGSDAVTTARATRGGVRYDHDVRGCFFGFGFFDAENDLLQLRNLRTAGGSGAGVHLFKSGNTQLNASSTLSTPSTSFLTGVDGRRTPPAAKP
jgi:uncharacterized protein DUF481